MPVIDDLLQDVQHGKGDLSKVVAAIREVERLVDERKVRNDVVDDRVLEDTASFEPRGIARVTAADECRQAR